MRLVVLLLLTALAGCADEPTDMAESMPVWASQPFVATVGLDQDMSFSQAPIPGTTPLGWSWAEWLQGSAPPTWSESLFAEDVILTSANVTLTYRPEGPLVSTLNRPQFTMWFGAGDSIIEHGFQAGPELWTGDETVTFPVDSLPLGGLTVPAGMPITLRVATYYPDGAPLETASVVLAGSHLELAGHTVQLAHPGTPERTSGTVELQGGRCVADLNQLGTAMGTGTFDVPADAVSVHVVLERATGIGGPDLDFYIQDANGTTVAYAAGPGSPEGILLREPNLVLAAPGTWSWHAYNCQPQVATVQMVVDVASADTVTH